MGKHKWVQEANGFIYSLLAIYYNGNDWKFDYTVTYSLFNYFTYINYMIGGRVGRVDNVNAF